MSEISSEEQDAQGMQRLAAGHDAALNELMGRHATRLFHYLIRLLQNETDAAELAQETFVRVYQTRARFNPRLKFSTWLYSIATNLARDRVRWRERHPNVSLDAEDADAKLGLRERLAAGEPTPAELMQARERVQAVRRAVAGLPEELQAPLVLAEYEGLSQAEIGEILGCTPKAVEMRIYRARQQLRGRLEKLLETA